MITKEEFDAARRGGKSVYVLRHTTGIYEERLSRGAEWGANCCFLGGVLLGASMVSTNDVFPNELVAVCEAIRQIEAEIHYRQSRRAELIARRDLLNGQGMNQPAKKQTISLPTWEDSRDGDVVLVRACENSRTLRVNMEEGFERCSKCYFGIEDLTCPVSPDDENVALCETHPSGCQVYFTTGSKE